MLLVSWLTVETIAVGLPWLLESLKVEYVEVPVEGSADTVGEKVLSVLGRRNGGTLLGWVVVIGSA